jgi:hypothetical protein
MRRARTQYSEEKVYKRHIEAHQVLSNPRARSFDRAAGAPAPPPDERVRSRVYRLALAQMGEKACMRFALKDVLGTLEGLNAKICRQSVQQEIVMTQDDPAEQLQALTEIIEAEDAELPSLGTGQFREMNNRELIEQVKIFAKMMKGRFDELLSAENNLYVSYAKERQRCMDLEAAQERAYSEAGSPTAAAIVGKLQQRDSQIEEIHTQLTQLQESLIEGLQAPENDTFSTKIEYLQRQVGELKTENHILQGQLIE